MKTDDPKDPGYENIHIVRFRLSDVFDLVGGFLDRHGWQLIALALVVAVIIHAMKN